MLILSHFLTNCLIVSVCCTSFPNFSTRVFPPMIWKMMISMKAHSFIRQYIPYHTASTMGLGIICLCTKLVCLSLHTTDIANQGHLSKKSVFTKCSCIQHKIRGPNEDMFAINTLSDIFTLTQSKLTYTGINKVYTPRSRNVTGMYMR